MSKFILKSKTVWGLIIMALPTLLTILGFEVSTATIGSLDTSMVSIIEGIGGLIAAYGIRDAQGGITYKP